MASLSLPRVLQTRKTSLEIEREHFEKSQVCKVTFVSSYAHRRYMGGLKLKLFCSVFFKV